MTPDDLINELLEREGGYRNVIGDRGGPTAFGISSPTWGTYKGMGRPATADEIKAITRDQAVAFYKGEFARLPWSSVADSRLQAQLWDFSQNSGEARTVRYLQLVLGVPVDGIFGERTRAALQVQPITLVNEALVAARCCLIVRGVRDGAIPKTDLMGLCLRALSFSAIGDPGAKA